MTTTLAPSSSLTFNRPLTINKIKAKQARDKATRWLLSWLGAVNIPAVHDNGIKQIADGSYDVIVQDATGALRFVNVEAGSADALGIDGKALVGDDTALSMATFHLLTETLGYGKPVPVDRGLAPDKKLCYKDDPDLVAMRHWLLRVSPDLSPAVFEQYRAIIDNTSKFFYNSNRKFLDLFGYSIEDAKQFARAWLMIYFHHYFKLDAVPDENFKLFTSYVKQKFSDWRGVIQLKANGCFPDGETLAVSISEENACFAGKLGNDPSEWKQPHEYAREPDASEDAGYMARHNLLDKRTDKTRRKSAQALLAKSLGALPHNEMVGLLRETAENARFCYDTRAQAKKELDKHLESCSVCPREDRAGNVDEDVAGMDATGT